jgi:phosphate transport system substrate-binding protein
VSRADYTASEDDNVLVQGIPGTDSGTFDYFTEEVNGESGVSRADYTASEDDNVLVQGISGDRNALGYFGYAYYAENMDKLKLVAVDSGAGCVAPSVASIADGTYSPLSEAGGGGLG